MPTVSTNSRTSNKQPQKVRLYASRAWLDAAIAQQQPTLKRTVNGPAIQRGSAIDEASYIWRPARRLAFADTVAGTVALVDVMAVAALALDVVDVLNFYAMFSSATVINAIGIFALRYRHHAQDAVNEHRDLAYERAQPIQPAPVEIIVSDSAESEPIADAPTAARQRHLKVRDFEITVSEAKKIVNAYDRNGSLALRRSDFSLIGNDKYRAFVAELVVLERARKINDNLNKWTVDGVEWLRRMSDYIEAMNTPPNAVPPQYVSRHQSTTTTTTADDDGLPIVSGELVR